MTQKKRITEYFGKHPKADREDIRPYAKRVAEALGLDPETVRTYYYRHYGARSSHKEKQNESTFDVDESKGKAEFIGYSDKPIKTLESALEMCQVDLSVWAPVRWVCNSWGVTMRGKDGNPTYRTNYQVKVWFEQIKDHDINWESIEQQLSELIANRPPAKLKLRRVTGSDVGVVTTADFHLGAYVDDLVRSEKFNIAVLIERLEKCAEIINSWGLSSVHIAMLGDFIESFTGMNHRNSWKGLDKKLIGMGAVQLCFTVLTDHFLYLINNLKGVYIVSGNHDRVTSDNTEDTKGEVADMLAWLIDREIGDRIEVKYHPMVITEVIDGIAYIFTHGHHKFSSRDLNSILFQYGVQGVYNVMVQGHLHSRMQRKAKSQKAFRASDVHVFQEDQSEHRIVTCPPIFTGNFYSESNGWTSSAGFYLFQNNSYGKPNMHDFSL
jgi:hypothetical protein